MWSLMGDADHQLTYMHRSNWNILSVNKWKGKDFKNMDNSALVAYFSCSDYFSTGGQAEKKGRDHKKIEARKDVVETVKLLDLKGQKTFLYVVRYIIMCKGQWDGRRLLSPSQII